MPRFKWRASALKKRLWPASIWKRLLVGTGAFLVLFATGSYAVAQWYIAKHNDEPMILGTTFVPNYAESFGLDPKETLQAILGDLKVKQIRLVSYWDRIEYTPGQYDFSELDWQFAMAAKHETKISLAIGLRQPRWPECHEPAWVTPLSKAEWQPKLNNFMKVVIDRYKNSPVLDTYELENEFFMKVFGECQDFDRQRLIHELELVKKLDPYHKVIISRSNNWVGLPVGKPTPDQFGISIYKRVWDKTVTHRYFEYPLPAWFYAALAGGGEILTGKDMIIHELQAEPWPPTDIHQASIAEQFKSMNAKRLKDRISYAEATGMRNIDLWGAEWWYWLKVQQNDPSVWNVVKQAIAQADASNFKLQSSKSK